MEQRAIITLTSDFGYKDPFVGIMKGVILSINPFATVVDITHGIRPQNILEAAFAIETGFKSFPHKTIHLEIRLRKSWRVRLFISIISAI